MPLIEELHDKRQEILDLAARNGLSNIRIFGSVLRGEEREDSDIDFLVSIEPTRRLTDLCRFRLDMKKMLGRECDVVSERGLHRLLRDKILSEARPL